MTRGARAIAAALVALGVAAAPARADSDASEPFPRSPDLVREPITKPWGAQASVSRTSFEIYLAGSPIGWSFGEDGNKYGALARAGLGLMRATDRTLLMVYGSYEVSRLSYVTFGHHANLIGLPKKSWAQAFGGGLALYVQPSGTVGFGLPVCKRHDSELRYRIGRSDVENVADAAPELARAAEEVATILGAPIDVKEVLRSNGALISLSVEGFATIGELSYPCTLEIERLFDAAGPQRIRVVATCVRVLDIDARR